MSFRNSIFWDFLSRHPYTGIHNLKQSASRQELQPISCHCPCPGFPLACQNSHLTLVKHSHHSSQSFLPTFPSSGNMCPDDICFTHSGFSFKYLMSPPSQWGLLWLGSPNFLNPTLYTPTCFCPEPKPGILINFLYLGWILIVFSKVHSLVQSSRHTWVKCSIKSRWITCTW